MYSLPWAACAVSNTEPITQQITNISTFSILAIEFLQSWMKLVETKAISACISQFSCMETLTILRKMEYSGMSQAWDKEKI